MNSIVGSGALVVLEKIKQAFKDFVQELRGLSNLQKRIIVALIYFPLLLLSAAQLQFFSLAVTILLIVAWHEYLNFKFVPQNREEIIRHWVYCALGAAPAAVVFLNAPMTLGFALQAVCLQVYIVKQMREGQTLTAITQSVAPAIFGTLYLTILFCSFLALQTYSVRGESVWYLLFVVGAADTGAYFAGRFYGKTPFFQHLSPSKTYEGFYGGMAGAVVVSAVYYIVFRLLEFTIPPIWLILPLGALVAAASAFGDLFESMLKRHYGVKDSGSFFPGHGGVLDRFDGVIFASLPLLFFVILRGGFR